MLIAAIAVPWAMSAQTPTETLIGSESSTTTDKYPVNDYYNYSLSETIIDASEIGDGAQTINSISLYYNYASPMTSKTNCTIYLQHTTKSTFSSSSDIEALSPDAVMVYTGSLNCTQGWNQFDFSNNFSYDGTSNLMVIIDDNSGDYDGSSYTFKTSSCTGYKTLFWYNDNVNPDLSNTSAFSSTKNYYQARCVMKLNGFKGAVSCPRVASISASNVSAYTATVSFTPSGNETAWIGTINPPLFGQSSIVLNDTVVNLIGLTPVTDYTVSVRAICGAGDTSMARNTSFRTTCAPYNIPFTENFDDYAASATPDCWTKMGSGTAAINNSTTYSHSGSMTLKFNGASPNIIALPQMSVPTNTLELTLWTRPENFTNGSCGQFDVGYVTDLTDADSFVAIATYNFDDFSDVEERTINYSNAPANATIALRHRTASASWYWFVDDIDVHPIPSCPKPATISASTIDAHSGLVQWTPAMPDQNNFVVAYGLGTDPSTMTTISATGTSAVISGLSAMTKYNVFVKAVCGTDDESLWSAMTSFMTQMDCGTGYELKDFTLGDGTSSSSSYAFYASSTYPFGYGAPIFTAEEIGANNLYENNTINAIRLHVGSTGGTINDAHIYMSNVAINNYTGASDTALFAEMTEVYSGTLDCPTNQWITIPLTTPFAYDANSNLMVRFAHSSTASAGVSFFYTNMTPNYYNIYGYRSSTGATASATKSYYRPNVEFMICSEVPSCFPVQSVTASNVNTTNANISWTLNDATQNSFTVAYGTTDDVATMATATVSNTNVTLYGLTPNTTYYATVRANCGSEDMSSWYRTISFHTPCDVADSALFFENFDSYTDNAIPDCWHQGWYYQNTASGVKTQPFLTSTTQKYGSTGRSMSLQDQGTGTLSYLSTQCLPIDRANKYAVSLQVYRSNYSTLKPNEGLKIWASPSANDTTGATLIGYIHRQYTLEPAEEAIGWYQYDFVIPQAGNQYILIEGISEYGAATYFDNLEVKMAPCLKNVPYTNNFENSETDMIPICWDNSASTTSSITNHPEYVWGTYQYSGNKMLRMYNYLVQTGLATINTNPFYIPNDGETYEMLVDISNRASCGNLTIAISNDNGASFTTLGSVSSTSNNNTDPGTFTKYNYNLNGYADDTVIFRFSANANYGNGAIFVDNFTVRAINTCVEPTDVTAETLTDNSASVSWTPADNTQNDFVVAYGTGSNPETMSTVSVSGTTTTISGLTPETTYNFFVKAICDDTHESYWSNYASIFTGYCIPTPSSVDNQGITNVTFGNGNEIVNNSQRPTSSPYYGNYYTMVGAAEVESDVDVAITYRTGYDYGTIIWVDWNKNLTFQSDEVVYVGEASSASPTVLNANFHIPATQDTGYYRMRIAGADSYYDSYTSSIEDAAYANPCPSSTYTIVHDYTLHVLPLPACRRPVNVVATDISDNNATISWSLTDTTENNFVVAYGTGTNPDEMTTITTITNTANITGLNNGTTYNVFVKAICSADEESDWTNMYSFTTLYCSEVNQCPIYVHMYDEYGDGWNGNSRMYIVDVLTNTTVASFKLEEVDGVFYAIDSAYLCRGHNFNLIWQEGSYDDEDSFVLISSNGDTIYAGSEPTNGTITTFTASCPITDSTVNVTFAINNSEMGYTTPAMGQYTYYVDDTVVATATANPGFRFTDWTIETDDIYRAPENVTLNPLTTILPAEFAAMDITITANFEVIPTSSITVLSNNDLMGTASGTGIYENGTSATLVATPAPNCHFVQWNDGDTNASCEVIVTSDATYTAYFDYNPVNVTLTVNDATMGTTNPAPGVYSFQVNDIVNATATAYTGYHFNGWTINMGATTIPVNTNPVSQVVPSMLAGMSFNITAQFAPDTFNITAQANNSFLGNVSGSGRYAYGDVATLVASPVANTHFVVWNDGDSNATRQVVVTGDATYTATFDYDPAQVVIAIDDINMGRTNPAPGTYTYNVGDSLTISATSLYGYHFTYWVASTGNTNDTILDNPIATTVGSNMAGRYTTYTAHYQANLYTITAVSDNPSMGITTGTGSYRFGDTATITASALANRHFVNWNDGDTNAVRRVPVTGDATYTAYFDYNPVNVTLAVNDANMGNTNPVPGTYTYHVSDTVITTAQPNSNYHFSRWIIEQGSSTDTLNYNPYSIILDASMAGENLTMTAYFEEDIPDMYYITVVSSNPILGTTTGSGSYYENDTITISATPASNAHFVVWNDGDSNATRQVIVTGNATYTATFDYDPAQVVIAIDDINMGRTNPAPGTYTYQVGDSLTISATSLYGYHFTYWVASTGNTNDTILDNPIATTVGSNMAGRYTTYTAHYQANLYTITAVSDNPSMGITTGTGSYRFGDTATITASALANRHFVNWNDGDTNAVRRVPVTGDATYTAYFDYNPVNVTLAVNDANMGNTNPVPGTYTYQVGDFINATAIPAVGHHFDGWLINNSMTETTNPVSIVVPDMLAGMSISVVANFAVDTFNVIAQANNSFLGNVSGSGRYAYGDVATLVASPVANTHFVVWNDGDTNATRQVVVTGDATYTATFDYDPAQVVIAIDDINMGRTNPAPGTYTYQVGDSLTISATSLYGYHFTYWVASTGNTNDTILDNPIATTVGSNMAGRYTTYTAHYQANLYTITAVSDNPSMGITTGTGSYRFGDTATITASALANRHFVNWNDGDTNASREVIVTSDATYTAYFDYNPVNVTLTVNDATMGTTNPAPGVYSFQVNDIVNATATAYTGYHFNGWTINMGATTIPVNTNPVSQVVPSMLAGMSFNITAQFAPDTFNITVLANNNLMGNVSGSGAYPYGEIVTLTATPLNNYHFVSWNDGNTDAVRQVTVTGNATYTATFDYNPVNVTLAVNDTNMGSTNPAPGTYTYNVGNNTNVTATSNYGYHFDHWVLTTGNTNDTLHSNPASITISPAMVGQLVQLTAYHAADLFTITAVSNNTAMGVTTGTGSYRYGDTATITAIAASNSHFVNWDDGDTNAVRQVIVSGNATYTANFDYNPVNVVLAVNDTDMGTTTPVPGSYTFNVGDSATVSATANNGYHFNQWTINWGDNSNSISTSTLAEVIPDAMAGMTCYVTAQFMPNIYHITVQANDYTYGTVTGSGNYAYGSTATITATPAEHCIFVQWEDGNTDAVRNVVVNGNATYTAIFAAIPQHVVILNVEGEGTVTGDGVYYEGDNVTITATAAENYQFVHWTDNDNNIIYTEPEVTFTMGAANVILNAIFEQNLPAAELTVSISEENMGYVTINGEIATHYTGNLSENVNVEAHANSGYTFDHWELISDNMVSMDASIVYTLVNTENFITAVFVRNEGIDEVEEDNIIIYSESNSIVVRNAEQETIRVYDAIGRLVLQRNNAAYQESIQMPATGIYLVKIGDRPARRVVVRR